MQAFEIKTELSREELNHALRLARRTMRRYETKIQASRHWYEAGLETDDYEESMKCFRISEHIGSQAGEMREQYIVAKALVQLWLESLEPTN